LIRGRDSESGGRRPRGASGLGGEDPFLPAVGLWVSIRSLHSPTFKFLQLQLDKVLSDNVGGALVHLLHRHMLVIFYEEETVMNWMTIMGDEFGITFCATQVEVVCQHFGLRHYRAAKGVKCERSLDTTLHTQTSYGHGVNYEASRSHAGCGLVAGIARVRLPCPERLCAETEPEPLTLRNDVWNTR